MTKHPLQRRIRNRRLIEFVHKKLVEDGHASTYEIQNWLRAAGKRHFDKSTNELANILAKHKSYFRKIPNDGIQYNKWKTSVWGAV